MAKTPTASGIPVYCSHDKIVPTEDVEPNPRNPNKHPEDQIVLLAKIIKQQGWRAPITVSTLSNLIVRGHGRLMAARRLGVREVPVDYQDYNTESEEWADLIADNRLAELANLDNKMLLDLIQDMDDGSTDLTLTGYTEEDLTKMINTMAGDQDQVPGEEDEEVELPDTEPITEPGDIWLLGGHRLICGDATNKEHVAELMQGDQAAAIFTDPPYGIDYVMRESDHPKFIGKVSGRFDVMKGDENKADDLIIKVLAPAFKNMVSHSIPEAGFYIFHAPQTRGEYEYAMKAAGLIEINYIIWAKANFLCGWSDYRAQYEPFFYASKEGVKPAFYGDRSQATVWRVTVSEPGAVTVALNKGIVLLDGQGGKLFISTKPPKGTKTRHIRLTKKDQQVYLHQPDEAGTIWEAGGLPGLSEAKEKIHPTQKPVELAKKAIENSTTPGQIVLDLFLGSGSTLIGAEATGRRCYGSELDPKYCDGIVTRWERFTGRTAERIPAGKNTITGKGVSFEDDKTGETGHAEEKTEKPSQAVEEKREPATSSKRTSKKAGKKKVEGEKDSASTGKGSSGNVKTGTQEDTGSGNVPF